MDVSPNSTVVYCEYSGLGHDGLLTDRGFQISFLDDTPWAGPVLKSIMQIHARGMRLITTASLRVYRGDELVVEERLQRLFQTAAS